MKSHIEIGFSSNKMLVINNGIDISKFVVNSDKRFSIRNQLGISNDIILIGMIARWDINKNHNLLLKTLNDFEKGNDNFNYKILLAGDSISIDNIELVNLLKKYSLFNKCYLIGSVENIEDYINALDLHILTSNSESFGNVTAECLACGVEVISTDVGLCHEFIYEGYGQIVPVNNSILLLEAIKNFFNNYNEFSNDFHRKMILRKNIVDSFNQEKMLSEYYQLWKNIHNNE
jgi:glycosyltransferase involved in cell wall biosynthesis